VIVSFFGLRFGVYYAQITTKNEASCLGSIVLLSEASPLGSIVLLSVLAILTTVWCGLWESHSIV